MSLFLTTTRHPYLLPPFVCLHSTLCITRTQWQSHSLTVLSVVWMGLCYMVYLEKLAINTMSVQMMGYCFKVVVEQVIWKEGHSFFFFCNISSFVNSWWKRGSLCSLNCSLCVIWVCLSERERNKLNRDKSNVKVLCEAEFFLWHRSFFLP